VTLITLLGLNLERI